MRTRTTHLCTVAMVAALVAGSCGSPVVTPSASPPPTPTITPNPSPSPSAAPTTSPSATIAPTDVPSASPQATLAGRWQPAGTTALGRWLAHAVPLGDGRVLVIGNDVPGSVRADSVRSEIWDPAKGTWSAGPSLNKPRAEFVAVPMAGGKVLVTGGVNDGGTTAEGDPGHHQSYSGTYAFDPENAAAGWARVALLAHARTAPAAAALLDGRVLVAGGYYLSGKTGMTDRLVEAGFAAPRPAVCGTTPCAVPPADVAPPTLIPALAGAELYDPVSDSWSATGNLRYARVGAPAVTLADGRVLVVGSALSSSGWNYTEVKLSDRAYSSAEIYDPHTGRFSLTGDLSPVDWSPLSKLGPYPISPQGVTSVGTLVALADGGALLVGQVTSWSIDALSLTGSTARTLRFDPATRRWNQVDQSVYSSVVADVPTPTDEIVPGHSRDGAIAVRMSDGRVLVAGGSGVKLSDAAEVFDPTTGGWSALPPMPQPLRDGAPVALADGSVLIVGGHGDPSTCPDECPGIPTAIRLVLGP